MVYSLVSFLAPGIELVSQQPAEEISQLIFAYGKLIVFQKKITKFEQTKKSR